MGRCVLCDSNNSKFAIVECECTVPSSAWHSERENTNARERDDASEKDGNILFEGYDKVMLIVAIKTMKVINVFQNLVKTL